MNEEQIERALEGIDLTSSESKVYLALLRLGASSSGKIADESRTAHSKIYDVLEKLIRKGLVSHFTRDGVKYFQAGSPTLISHYLEEKKKAIDAQEETIASVIPQLMRLHGRKSENAESVIFSGKRGVRSAFTQIVSELDKGDDIRIMGVHDFGESFLPLALYFQQIRSEKGISAKFLMNHDAGSIAKEFEKYRPVSIRFLPEDILTPAIFLLYKDTVVINIAKELTFFMLRSSHVHSAFESYFQHLWKQSRNKRI